MARFNQLSVIEELSEGDEKSINNPPHVYSISAAPFVPGSAYPVLSAEVTKNDGKKRSYMNRLLGYKHPLEHKWALYYCKQDKNKKWEDCMVKVEDFDTVEDFWALFHHAKRPSELDVGCDYYMFKEGIQPMWEDSHNKNGGRWLIMMSRNQRSELLDQYWNDLLMAMVGEQFGIGVEGEQICGAVVNIRAKGDKISLWTGKAEDEKAVMKIGRVVKDKLKVVDEIRYEVNQDLKLKQSSVIRPRVIL